MDREILFSGKSGDVYVYGDLIHCNGQCFIKNPAATLDEAVRVDESTVRQYSGIRDNGLVRIYEGDKLLCTDDLQYTFPGTMIFDKARLQFVVRDDTDGELIPVNKLISIEIVPC